MIDPNTSAQNNCVNSNLIGQCNSTLQFTCNSGRCIDISLRCNGRPDCYDSTDEVGCKPSCKKMFVYLTNVKIL